MVESLQYFEVWKIEKIFLIRPDGFHLDNCSLPLLDFDILYLSNSKANMKIGSRVSES